jgi:hypothetical protein
MAIADYRFFREDFSDVRASFQQACFSFIKMGGSGGNNGSGGSLKF